MFLQRPAAGRADKWKRMGMRNNRRVAGWFLAWVVGVVGAAFLVGCDVGSSGGSDAAIREVGVDYSGYYDSTDDNSETSIVSPVNSGAPVKSLSLSQTGDRLEAFDNNGLIYRGTIGRVVSSGGSAESSFQLEGETTTRVPVTIAGTLTGEGTTGIMRGQWLEPNKMANILADAIINAVPTNQTQTVSVAISPKTSTLNFDGETQQFTASGGSGSYEWTLSSYGVGGVTPTTGSTVTYNRDTAGNNTITVTDTTTKQTDSATITQP